MSSQHLSNIYISFVSSVQALTNSPWYEHKHTVCSDRVDNSICYAALIRFWGLVFEVHALEEFGRLFLSTLGCLQAPPQKEKRKPQKYIFQPAGLALISIIVFPAASKHTQANNEYLTRFLLLMCLHSSSRSLLLNT